MAKIGDYEIAARYDGISAGPRLDYTFETQQGIPIDGGNKLLREMSPFRFRLVPPDALLTASAQIAAGVDLHSTIGAGTAATESTSIRTAQARSVDLINAAARGADQSPLASELGKALARVSAIGTAPEVLESFIASGKFFNENNNDWAVTLADTYTAADIGLQLQRIIEAPTLTLLVNPNNLTINYNNIQSYASRTRDGFIFERWGEDQPTMSFQGSTGAFIAGSADATGTVSTLGQITGDTSSPTGVQFASKRDSAAFQNLMALLLFYKSNGYVYDTVNETEAHLFVGAVAIDYDQWTYVGHIESFEYSYSSEKPHNIDWTMEFKIDRMFDNAQPVAVVLPQTAPTESPQGLVNRGGTGGGTVGDALAGVGSSIDAATDANSEFGVMPFELLVPTT